MRAAFVALLAVAASLASYLPPGELASGHPPPDPLHGGQGNGVEVIGHSDLGGAGLNGHVAVLGDYAYVGFGTNGGQVAQVCGFQNTGFSCSARGAQWNRTPNCRHDANPPAGSVKVVSLEDPTRPAVVTTIPVGGVRAPGKTVARDVAALRVNTPLFTGDLLAVALESCSGQREDNADPVQEAQGRGLNGVKFFDVTDPKNPKLLSFDDRSLGTTLINQFGSIGVRQVSMVQRPDGKVIALEANQAVAPVPGSGIPPEGGVNVVDITNPALPTTVATLRPPDAHVLPANIDTGDNCRPFKFAQGVTPNSTGTKAYIAYQDAGLFVGDLTKAKGEVALTGPVTYPATEEGNSFRFVPNHQETVALVTDEDLLPAKTTITFSKSNPPVGPHTIPVCEAIWGSPLFRRPSPSMSANKIVRTGQGSESCMPYLGIPDVVGNFVYTSDNGYGTVITCGREKMAKTAQEEGATAILIGTGYLGPAGPSHDPAIISSDARSGEDSDQVTIPVLSMTQQARNLLAFDGLPGTDATMTNTPGAWGGLRIFDISGPPSQIGEVFKTAHTDVLPGSLPPELRKGDFHAVNATWAGDKGLVAWMSDGLRVVDVADPASPTETAFYVPPAVADPTGQYPQVPLVVDVERFGSYAVITDISGGLYVLKIQDLLPQLNVTVAPITVTEGDGGSIPAVFNVSVNPPLGVPVTIDYQTAGDSAEPNEDFMPAAGRLTLAANQAAASFQAPVVGDTVPEPTEQFFVDVTASIDAVSATARGIGTILDPDTLPAPPPAPNPAPGEAPGKTGSGTTTQPPPQQTVQQTAQQTGQQAGQAQQPAPAQPQAQPQLQTQVQSQMQAQNEAAFQAQPVLMVDEQREAQPEQVLSHSTRKSGYLASARAPGPLGVQIGFGALAAIMMSAFSLVGPQKDRARARKVRVMAARATFPRTRPSRLRRSASVKNEAD